MQKVKRLKKHWLLYVMMLPGLLYFLINNYIPMFGVLIAFKKMDFSKGILKSPWAGFSNFEYLFATKDALLITRNTIFYNLAFIVVNTIVGIIIAILICDVKSKKLKSFYQSIIMFPFMMSMVILSYIVYAVLSSENGFLNNTVLPLLNMEPIGWYMEKKYWPFILIFVNCWKGAGYGCLIYIASLNGIDPTYYEAAKLDGASRWNEIVYITLPNLVPTIVTMTLLSIGKIFYADFGLFYQVPMNSGMLYPVTNVIDTYVYRAMSVGNIGMSSAACVYQSFVGFVLVMLSNWIVKKIDNDKALF